MEDFDEITSYLRPTRKNNMILGGLLAFAVVSFLVAGWLQSVSAEYSNVAHCCVGLGVGHQGL